MFNLDPSKMAKNAVEGLQKAEKLGGGAGEAAKGVLQGIKKAEKLADLEKAPEQVIAALRKLLAEAKQLANSSANKNEALDTCIQKAQTLLDSDNISTEAVTKLTAELGALIKNASAGASQQPANQKGSGSPDAARTAPPPTANVQKNANAAPKREVQPAAARPAARPAAARPAAAKPAETKPAETTAKKVVQFSDVDASAYYYDAVQWAVQRGIASGTSETTFSPDQECTYGQTITFLWRSVGSPAPKGQNNPFTDVKENVYYYQPALWAAERGIVSGTTFHPDEPVTRGQFAAFLYRNAGSPAVESKTDFTDVPSGANYAQAVAWVAAQGITSGTGDHTFSPDAVCTRGQIVTFLHRAKK
ncbi:MAG: S-layer homology domain-containing protein [Oscillospiraceae bacterium]|nr:S-layer homology domain-containing protein [Oscillospiraceae bacterium]